MTRWLERVAAWLGWYRWYEWVGVREFPGFKTLAHIPYPNGYPQRSFWFRVKP